MFIGAGVGAVVQTGVDTIETVIRGEPVDLAQTAIDLGLNFATTLGGNFLGARIIPTNGRWFQPQKFFSVFLKPYGQKILMQTAIGATLSGIVNFLRKNDWEALAPSVIAPVIY